MIFAIAIAILLGYAGLTTASITLNFSGSHGDGAAQQRRRMQQQQQQQQQKQQQQLQRQEEEEETGRQREPLLAERERD